MSVSRSGLRHENQAPKALRDTRETRPSTNHAYVARSDFNEHTPQAHAGLEASATSFVRLKKVLRPLGVALLRWAHCFYWMRHACSSFGAFYSSFMSRLHLWAWVTKVQETDARSRIWSQVMRPVSRQIWCSSLALDRIMHAQNNLV